MSIENLAQELVRQDALEIAQVREKVQSELDAAASGEQRGRVLAIFNMTLDQAERNLAARGDQGEVLEQLRKARAQCYKMFLVRECTVGVDAPGGGDVSVEMLMAVTNREMGAGRMTEDHPLRRMAVEGAAAPHWSHADLVAKHAQLRAQLSPAKSTDTDTPHHSRMAYAFGHIVGRKVKGFFKE